MTTGIVLWIVILLAVIAWVFFMAGVKLMLEEIRLLRADHTAIKSVIEKWIFELKRVEKHDMDK